MSCRFYWPNIGAHLLAVSMFDWISGVTGSISNIQYPITTSWNPGKTDHSKNCYFKQWTFLSELQNSAAIKGICVTTAGIKKYKSILKKNKKKKRNKIVLLGKDKLSIVKVLISKALIDSYISHDEFISVKNTLIEY